MAQSATSGGKLNADVPNNQFLEAKLTPSMILKLGEQRIQLQMELDKTLRDGFTGISGIRATARSGVLLLSPLTWPEVAIADFLVDDQFRNCQNQLSLAASNESEERLRNWCGGFKPPVEVASAKASFSHALEVALQLVQNQQLLQNQN
jgi:hypothetical protein